MPIFGAKSRAKRGCASKLACIASARAVQTVFTRIFGEFVIAQRADVGIGPYKTSVNSYCSASFERKANLPQLF